ncbi:Phthiocerol/phenolphthiocerol synthesis polyketide synthase type I PpsC [compost metagenome]
MRSFIGTSYDSTESFSLQEVPLPQPGPGQVRIRIEATALGFVDGLMVQGRYQIRPELPYIPGGEIAGVVDAVGLGVKTVEIGNRIVTWQLGGGLAEYVVVSADEVHLVEEGLSSTIAASMLVDYQTAYYAVFEKGRVTAADTVLVLGATGGVGSAALQLAASAGAFVIAAASTEDKRKMAHDLGARATVDYLSPNWRDELKRVAPGAAVDVVFDPVGGDTFEPAFRSLGKEGRYLVVGFAAGRIPSLPINLALLKSASLLGIDIRHFLSTQPMRARKICQSLFSMVRSGILKPPSIASFSLERSKEAISAAISRDKQGKVVVLMGTAATD